MKGKDVSDANISNPLVFYAEVFLFFHFSTSSKLQFYYAHTSIIIIVIAVQTCENSSAGRIPKFFFLLFHLLLPFFVMSVRHEQEMSKYY